MASSSIVRLSRTVRTRVGVAVACLWAAGACGGRVAYEPDLGEMVRASQANAALGPGDVIEIRVFQEKELSGEFQVGADGSIDYPLLGTLQIGDATPSQVAERVREGLANGYLRDPFVTVTVKELVSKRVYVLGQVAKPGTFPYEDGMTIIHVITLAGGFTKIARPNAVVVTRVENGEETRTVVPVNEISEGRARNFFLRPGDIVFVPESIL